MTTKFKGLRVFDNTPVTGDLIQDKLIGKCYILPFDTECYDDYEEVIPESVGQFSGEKDKDGNDIYSTDHIIFDDEFETTIEFKNGAFGYEGTYGFYTLHETNLGMLKIKK